MSRWHAHAGVDKAGRLAKTVQAEDHGTVMFTSKCAENPWGPGAQKQVHIHCMYHWHFKLQKLCFLLSPLGVENGSDRLDSTASS